MRFPLLLSSLALLTVTSSGQEPRAVLREHAEMRAIPVVLDPSDPAHVRVGALTYLGGVRLTSPDPAFGGFSALSVTGDRFTLLSDGGNVVRFRMGADWRPREVHMAMVNERRFLFSSGLGLDASVVARVDAHPHLKARFGPYYFAYCGFGEFLGKYVARPPRLETVTDGGGAVPGVTVLVQKGEPYTYFRRIPIHAAHGATLTDPTLAGIVLRSTRPTVMPGVMYRLFSAKAKLEKHRQVDGFAGVRDVLVRSVDGRPVPLHVDGDYIGDVTEARYSVDEQPLLVVS